MDELAKWIDNYGKAAPSRGESKLQRLIGPEKQSDSLVQYPMPAQDAALQATDYVKFSVSLN